MSAEYSPNDLLVMLAGIKVKVDIAHTVADALIGDGIQRSHDARIRVEKLEAEVAKLREQRDGLVTAVREFLALSYTCRVTWDAVDDLKWALDAATKGDE